MDMFDFAALCINLRHSFALSAAFVSTCYKWQQKINKQSLVYYMCSVSNIAEEKLKKNTVTQQWHLSGWQALPHYLYRVNLLWNLSMLHAVGFSKLFTIVLSIKNLKHKRIDEYITIITSHKRAVIFVVVTGYSRIIFVRNQLSTLKWPFNCVDF